MVAAVSFRDVAIGIVEIPLAARGTSIVARSSLRVKTELGHEASADVVEMEIAADAELCEMKFVRAENFAGAADGVVLGMMKIVDVIGVDANFRSEEFRVEGEVFGAGVAVEPGEIGEGERFGLGGLIFLRGLSSRRSGS